MGELPLSRCSAGAQQDGKAGPETIPYWIRCMLRHGRTNAIALRTCRMPNSITATSHRGGSQCTSSWRLPCCMQALKRGLGPLRWLWTRLEPCRCRSKLCRLQKERYQMLLETVSSAHQWDTDTVGPQLRTQ